MDYITLLLSAAFSALGLLLFYWWLWLPWAVLGVFLESSAALSRDRYLSQMRWVLLELQVPLDVHRSPKAMEQTFNGMHGIGMSGTPKKLSDKYNAWRNRHFVGRVPDWFSLEIVSIGGQIHFYIRCLETHRHIIQAQIYAHYPEAEISQVADYVSQLPAQLPNDEYEMTGQELALTKEDAYPIRTYLEFEEERPGKDDAKRIDPLGPLAEAMAALSLGEHLGIQFLVRSADDSWVKKAQEVFDKIFDRPVKAQQDPLDKFASSIENTVSGVLGGAAEVKKEEKKAKSFGELSIGMQDVVKALERSLTKFGFYTGIRVIYLARKDRFVKERLGSVMAAFRLFSTPNLNGFKVGFSPEVSKGRHKADQTLDNKHYLYQRYRFRSFPEKPFVLNAEELATVFHFPDVSVHTPTLPRIEAKKGEAPTNLPIV